MLKKMIEGTKRCILRFVPERGWSATAKEVADDSELDWWPGPLTAVSMFTASQADNMKLSEEEIELMVAVEDRKERWACEWWKDAEARVEGGYAPDGWIRPFAVTV